MGWNRASQGTVWQGPNRIIIGYRLLDPTVIGSKNSTSIHSKELKTKSREKRKGEREEGGKRERLREEGRRR